jgi:hypothetical protein
MERSLDRSESSPYNDHIEAYFAGSLSGTHISLRRSVQQDHTINANDACRI